MFTFQNFAKLWAFWLSIFSWGDCNTWEILKKMVTVCKMRVTQGVLWASYSFLFIIYLAKNIGWLLKVTVCELLKSAVI